MTDEKPDTMPAPPPCSCMTEVRDLVAEVLKQQKAMRAELDLCINYIQGESLQKAAAIRTLTGKAPGSYDDPEEDTQPGRRQ